VPLPALPRTTALRMSDRVPSEEIARACEQIRTCLHPLVGPSFIVRARRLTPNTQSEAIACGLRVRVGVSVRESPSLYRERERRVDAGGHASHLSFSSSSKHRRVNKHRAWQLWAYTPLLSATTVRILQRFFEAGDWPLCSTRLHARGAVDVLVVPAQHNQQSLCHQSTYTSI
jgi:hypothetical protein